MARIDDLADELMDMQDALRQYRALATWPEQRIAIFGNSKVQMYESMVKDLENQLISEKEHGNSHE